MIPDDVIETVREAADLVGIIGETVELKTHRADYRGRCSLSRRHASNFAVIPKKGCSTASSAMKRATVHLLHEEAWHGLSHRGARSARRVGSPSPSAPARPAGSARAAVRAAPPRRTRFARQLRESPRRRSRANTSSRGMSRWNRRRLGAWDSDQGHGVPRCDERLGLREEVLLEAGLLVKRDDARRVRVSEAGCFSQFMTLVREW